MRRCNFEVGIEKFCPLNSGNLFEQRFAVFSFARWALQLTLPRSLLGSKENQELLFKSRLEQTELITVLGVYKLIKLNIYDKILVGQVSKGFKVCSFIFLRPRPRTAAG